MPQAQQLLKPTEPRCKRSVNEDTALKNTICRGNTAQVNFIWNRDVYKRQVLGLPPGVAELGRTGAGMLHVAGAFRSMEHLGGGTRGLDDVLRQFFNCLLYTSRCV